MWRSTIIVLLFLGLFHQSWAEDFIQGKDYILLSVQSPHSAEKKQIVEFFSFGCRACFNLETRLEPWIKNHAAEVTFLRNPVIFHPDWEVYARAYYIAQSLNILPAAFPAIFKAVQEQRILLHDNESMIKFFIQTLHADQELVTSAFLHATGIDMQIQKGVDESVAYGIMRIPSFVINNKYKTDLVMAQNPERLLAIMNELVKK